MSSIVSPAQRLTADILLLIAKYVANEKSLPFREVSSDKRRLIAFLTVCLNWRQVALEYIWHDVTLTLNPKSTRVYLTRLPWVKEYLLPPNVASLVKVLHIGVHMAGIVNGIAHMRLTKYLGDTKCFPFANRVVVTIESVSSKKGTVENVLEFAQLVKSLAPAATAIEVVCAFSRGHGRNYFEERIGELDEDKFGVFVKSLCSGSTYAKMGMGNTGLLHMSTIDCVPQLSWLQLFCNNPASRNLGLVHKSANTLKYLDIGITDPSTLFYDANNSNVTYPNLQHLHLSDCVGNDQNKSSVSSEIVPFPVLKSLRIIRNYSYFNDVIFRGNGDTLEYLEFGITRYAVEMCNRGKVFNKHTALRHVIIKQDREEDDLDFLSLDDMRKFLTNLTKDGKRLVCSSYRMLSSTIAVAQVDNGFQNIRVFETRSHKLDFLQVLRVLKALPAISDLRCGIVGMGPGLEDIPADDLPDHVISTHGDMDNNLQVWKMTSFIRKFNSETIDYILLLALLCPKLRRVELAPNAVPNYHTLIAESLESGPFSKYASQLGHVVDIIYE